MRNKTRQYGDSVLSTNLSANDEPLAALANELINVKAPVQWMLRLYQRHDNKSWTCHREWSL
ncbi:MAG: hypothetical protein AAF702_03385 [Chloroflexota bacterium]